MLIGSLPALCAKRFPKKTAAFFKGQTLSFLDFENGLGRLTAFFHSQGLRPGDKVGVLSRNNPAMLQIMFAAARMGLVYVPLNFRLTGPELKFVINDAGIDILFYSTDFKPGVDEIGPEITCKKTIVFEPKTGPDLPQIQEPAPMPDISPDDLFGIFYTSGTTGGPKGVMLSHSNFMSAAVNHIIAYQMSRADVCYHSQPFYHTMQASLAICCFYVGASSYITDSFDGREFWTAVRDHGVNSITLVYTMLVEALRVFEDEGFSKCGLHTFAVGGQSVPVDIIQKTTELMGPGMIFQVYGLTEASPLLTYLPREEIAAAVDPRRLASIGQELYSCRVRVVDEQDRDVNPGEFGEIIAQGPNVMKGYWNRPEETEAALAGGWLRTGDVAERDEDGYLYIVDRKKDIIISGGENISSREVEEALYAHPQVLECAVIGVPDPKWGEHVRAVVVPRPGENPSEEEISGFCRSRLAAYKTPKSFVFLKELPKDPLGKIQKKILRREYGH